MQGRDDVAGFIAGFAGDDRYIVDYLVEEVLHRQPDDVRSFLLETSILDRLSGPLCDAVTGQGGGKAMLEALDRGNLFLVPLDDRRRWYRYHQLFADVLRARLLDEQPDRVPELHRRASDWYEQNGDRSEAIRHAMAGGGLRASGGPGRARDPGDRPGSTGGDAAAAGSRRCPTSCSRVRPVLSNALRRVAVCVTGRGRGRRGAPAGRRAVAGRDGEAAEGPNAAERTAMVVVDEAAFRRLPGSIAVHRAGAGPDRSATWPAPWPMPGGRSTSSPRTTTSPRGAAAGLLALASWTSGDLEAAYRLVCRRHARAWRRPGTSPTSIGCAHRPGRHPDRAGSPARGDAHLRAGIARSPPGRVARAAGRGGHARRDERAVLRERDDLEARAAAPAAEPRSWARRTACRRTAIGRASRWPGSGRPKGDLDGALELLDEAERLYVGDFSPDVRPIAALRARVWIAQGRLAEASGWARERGLSAEDELSYVREFEHVTLARLLLAQGARDRADAPRSTRRSELLERLLAAAEDGGRNGSVIEILVAAGARPPRTRGDVAARLRRSSARWRWPSRRATSASSSTKGRRWRRC